MEIWNAVTGFLSARVEQLGLSFAHTSPILIILAIIVPVVLAATSRQWIVLVAVALLTAAVFAIDGSLNPASILVAIESYVAAIVLGVVSLQASLRNRAIKIQLNDLRAELDALKRAEERRFVNELNPTRSGQGGAAPLQAEALS